MCKTATLQQLVTSLLENHPRTKDPLVQLKDCRDSNYVESGSDPWLSVRAECQICPIDGLMGFPNSINYGGI